MQFPPKQIISSPVRKKHGRLAMNCNKYNDKCTSSSLDENSLNFGSSNQEKASTVKIITYYEIFMYIKICNTLPSPPPSSFNDER